MSKSVLFAALAPVPLARPGRFRLPMTLVQPRFSPVDSAVAPPPQEPQAQPVAAPGTVNSEVAPPPQEPEPQAQPASGPGGFSILVGLGVAAAAAAFVLGRSSQNEAPRNPSFSRRPS